MILAWSSREPIGPKIIGEKEGRLARRKGGGRQDWMAANKNGSGEWTGQRPREDVRAKKAEPS